MLLHDVRNRVFDAHVLIARHPLREPCELLHIERAPLLWLGTGRAADDEHHLPRGGSDSTDARTSPIVPRRICS